MTSIPMYQCYQCKHLLEREFADALAASKKITAELEAEGETKPKTMPKRCPKCGSDRLARF